MIARRGQSIRGYTNGQRRDRVVVSAIEKCVTASESLETQCLRNFSARNKEHCTTEDGRAVAQVVGTSSLTPLTSYFPAASAAFFGLAAAQSPATTVRIVFGLTCLRNVSRTFSGVRS